MTKHALFDIDFQTPQYFSELVISENISQAVCARTELTFHRFEG